MIWTFKTHLLWLLTKILTKFLKKKNGGHVFDKLLVQLSADGNCLFNAISIAPVEHEGLSIQIRVLTCIELVEIEKFYNSAAHGNYKSVSPNYDVSCKDAATIGGGLVLGL